MKYGQVDPEAGCEPPNYDVIQFGCGGEILFIPAGLGLGVFILALAGLGKVGT